MTGRLLVALLLVAPGLASPGAVWANGVTQREIQGTVVAADPGRGILVVERTFRGKATRIRLTVREAVRVFSCGSEAVGLDRVKVGATVSVFYEVAGSAGVANMIVVEPGR
jgi:hypothetical protein